MYYNYSFAAQLSAACAYNAFGLLQDAALECDYGVVLNFRADNNLSRFNE